MQSVNQINAQIKLMDVWKSLYSDTHPTRWARRNDSNTERRTRSAGVNQLSEAFGGKILTSTFVNDADKLWNNNCYFLIINCQPKQRHTSSQIRF